MNIPETYAYLCRARRDLWACLEGAPDGVLSRPLLPGPRFACIKDLVVHVASVEDSWLHEDILRDAPVWEGVPALRGAQDGPHYAAFPLAVLLDYWRQVEASTLAYLARLDPAEEARDVAVGPGRQETHTAHAIVWHVLIHEMRHTAQIAMLLRLCGVAPPEFDLLNYVPARPLRPSPS